jgi:putative N6-adenine-specific DNA methylase
MGETLALFAVTAPGLEGLAAAELREMGIAGVAESGGVAWEGTAADLYEANLRLRTASRVLVRVDEFRAKTFFELERKAAKVAWERFVERGGTVRLRVTCRKSRLYHEGAVAERLLTAIEKRAGPLASVAAARGAPDAEDEADPEAPGGGGDGAQTFVVRFLRDTCTISADASGALLHRRGYRQAVARAPLRETLAAAMLAATGWTGRTPLLDPMCGSGTLVIEAALLARRIAPGLANEDHTPRDYAFLRWPEHDADAWAEVVDRARADILPRAEVPILGSDRDAGAIEAALANAARAGVGDDVELSVRALSMVEPPRGPGLVVTNPPYGLRVGEREGLRDLYAALGRLARTRLDGWTVALLSADPRLEGHTGLELRELLRTNNGGIPVRVVAAEPAGD